MLTHSRIPWTKLTKHGVPAFTVSRRPLRVGEEELPVGAPIPHSVFCNRIRMRQMYEQRLIDPVLSEQLSKITKQPHRKEIKVLNPVPVAEAATKIVVPVGRTYTPSKRRATGGN